MTTGFSPARAAAAAARSWARSPDPLGARRASAAARAAAPKAAIAASAWKAVMVPRTDPEPARAIAALVNTNTGPYTDLVRSHSGDTAAANGSVPNRAGVVTYGFAPWIPSIRPYAA